MKAIKVNLKERSYRIIIGRGLLQQSGEIIRRLGIGNAAYVITNSLIQKKYGRRLSKALKGAGFSVRFKLIPDSERSKSMKVALSIISDLTAYDKKRQVFIAALGGGVIGDIAGFVASIYKRGIPYINLPTTLLSQVDSAIGGKTAVDLTVGKNLVGAFYQPRLVLSDTSTLDSLPARQLRAGLSEAIKYGIIKDRPLFVFLEKNYREIFALDSRKIEFIVYRCSRIKAGIIELDEKEKKGIRTVLNFGHTIGHAVEAASGFKGIGHGEAVAIGMVSAAYISKRLGLIEQAAYLRIKQLIRAVGLPTGIGRLSVSRIIKAHYRDKKFIGVKNRFVLIKGIGRPAIIKNIRLDIIRESLKAS